MAYKYRPKGNYNKNKDNNILPILLIVIGIFSGFGILIPIGVFWLIYLAKNADENNTVYTRSYRPRTRPNSTKPIIDIDIEEEDNRNIPLVKYSSKQMAMINERLKDYFSEYVELPVMDGINLRLKNKSYRSLNSLNIFNNNDYVCSLAEFGYQFPKTYNQILRLLLSFAMDENPEYKQSSKPAKKVTKKVEDKEEVKLEARTDSFITIIDDLNTAIPDEEISNGLYESTALLKQIKTIEETFPSSSEKLDKLYSYYLPILVNILNQYKDLEKTQHNEKFKQTKEKLQKTIILINDAMKTLTATLCEDDILNLSADISTLEAILKKDGLVGEGIMKKKAGENDEQ